MLKALDSSFFQNSSSGKRQRNRLGLGLASIAILIGLVKWPGFPEHEPGTETAPTAGQLKRPVATVPDGTSQALVPTPELRPSLKEISYAIGRGDTLSAIFSELELEYAVLDRILAADESLLALDTLQPGHRLTFHLDRHSGRLQQMELFLHAGNRVIYEQAGDGLFEYRELRRDGEWEYELFAGEIHGSFYQSAKSAGLNDRDVFTVSRIFEEQLNFNRDFRAGDTFRVIRSHNVVDGEPTGKTRIEGIRVERRNHEHTAFLFDDGLYYDENGDSLERAFSRLPVASRFHVTSSFAPDRRHPVTGRIAPHNGTDFATPVGSPVHSTGDGVVTRVEDHPYAGLYVEIEHGERYTTRYLHLSEILVERGQTVSRDERIALSGNTGRTTGPHLHFELHVNGRPVDAIEEDIPQADSVPETKMASFDRRVAKLSAGMEHERSLQLATSATINWPPSTRAVGTPQR